MPTSRPPPLPLCFLVGFTVRFKFVQGPRVDASFRPESADLRPDRFVLPLAFNSPQLTSGPRTLFTPLITP